MRTSQRNLHHQLLRSGVLIFLNRTDGFSRAGCAPVPARLLPISERKPQVDAKYASQESLHGPFLSCLVVAVYGSAGESLEAEHKRTSNARVGMPA